MIILPKTPYKPKHSNAASDQNELCDGKHTSENAASRQEAFTSGEKKTRMKPWKKTVLIIICVIVALLIAIASYAAWYLHGIQQEIAIRDTSVEEVLSSEQKGEAYYTLVLGSDSREGTSNTAMYSGDQQRSDVMILLRVDASSKQLTMVSIPRDTPIELNGQTVKINEAFNQGGAALAVQKVEELTKVSISHVVVIHFSEFENLIDTLGGITVTVPQDISYKDALTGETVSVKAGTQTLDGQHALIFARVRKSYDTSSQDAVRQSNVRVLALAIIKKISEEPVTKLPAIFTELANCIETDYSVIDIMQLERSFTGSGVTIYSCTGPYQGGLDEATGLWLVYPDQAGWDSLMQKVDAGQDPNS